MEPATTGPRPALPTRPKKSNAKDKEKDKNKESLRKLIIEAGLFVLSFD